MLVELPNIKLDNVVARMVAQNSEPLSSSIGSDLDDWETDPNYRNTNIIVPRVSNGTYLLMRKALFPYSCDRDARFRSREPITRCVWR